MMKVGVIGLGVLGKPIAERLVAKGFEVAAYDVRAEPVAALAVAGATPCEGPAEVAQRSDYIITLVSDYAQTQEVIVGPDGLLTTLREETVVIIGSTLGPAPVRALSGLIGEHGGETLDAPISGGYLAAADGTLSMMIGGRQAILDRAMPVLSAIANRITRAGGVGAGQAAKLAHQDRKSVV